MNPRTVADAQIKVIDAIPVAFFIIKNTACHATSENQPPTLLAQFWLPNSYRQSFFKQNGPNISVFGNRGTMDQKQRACAGMNQPLRVVDTHDSRARQPNILRTPNAVKLHPQCELMFKPKTAPS